MQIKFSTRIFVAYKVDLTLPEANIVENRAGVRNTNQPYIFYTTKTNHYRILKKSSDEPLRYTLELSLFLLNPTRSTFYLNYTNMKASK